MNTGSALFEGINALILSGGDSSRMGTDKAWISYHGKPQVLWLYDLLESMGMPVWISARTQDPRLQGRNCCTDLPAYAGNGPLSGVLSAWETGNRTAAWLIIGCDYPLYGEAEIRHLLAMRHANSLATVYAPEGKPLPFPAIWEPAMLEILESGFQQQYYSMQGLLTKHISRLNIIPPLSALNLQGADTPEDMVKIRQQLRMNRD